MDMGATLGGRNQVDVTLGDRLAAFRKPGNRPIGHLVIAGGDGTLFVIRSLWSAVACRRFLSPRLAGAPQSEMR